MADDMTDAEANIAEQARWGLSRTDLSLASLVKAARLIVTRLKALEDRVSRLEGKP